MVTYWQGPRPRRSGYDYTDRRNKSYHDRNLYGNSGTASRLGFFSWLDGPQKSGPSLEERENLKERSARPANQHSYLKREEAFGLAEQALEDYRRTDIYCLHCRMSSAEKQSLPFRIFNDLDKELFRSVLRGNVSLCWAHLSRGYLSETRPAGIENDPRIQILLSHQLHEEARPVTIIVSLLHQMIHAYYLQCCGSLDYEFSGTGHDLGHGYEFYALMRSMEKKLPIISGPMQEHEELMTSHRERARLDGHANKKSICYHRAYRQDSLSFQNWRNLARAMTKSAQESHLLDKDPWNKEQ